MRAGADPAGTPPALFTALAQVAVDSAHPLSSMGGTGPLPVQVDPRPLRTRRVGGVETVGSAMSTAGAPKFDSLPTSERAARVAALRRARIPVGDMSALDRCPGGLSTEEERKACPGRLTTVAAFGILNSTATRAVVQVVVLQADRAKSATISEVEMQLRRGQWVLARLTPVMILE